MKSTSSTRTPRIVDFAKEREIQEISRLLRTFAPFSYVVALKNFVQHRFHRDQHVRHRRLY